jgi:hypothetical protein
MLMRQLMANACIGKRHGGSDELVPNGTSGLAWGMVHAHGSIAHYQVYFSMVR